MLTLYYIQDLETKYPAAHSGLIYDNKSSLEDRMNSWAKGLYDPKRYEIRSFELDDKCKCENYMQTTMVVIFTNSSGVIELVCTGNLVGIYNLVQGISFGTDIEKETGGRYQMMTLNHFNEHYRINTW